MLNVQNHFGRRRLWQLKRLSDCVDGRARHLGRVEQRLPLARTPPFQQKRLAKKQNKKKRFYLHRSQNTDNKTRLTHHCIQQFIAPRHALFIRSQTDVAQQRQRRLQLQENITQ